MASAVAQGVKAAGADVELLTAAEFDAGKVGQYDAIAFGCPAMGEEALEEEVFAPMFESVKGALGGKKIALFGSYGWGDREWMQKWEEQCAECGHPRLRQRHLHGRARRRRTRELRPARQRPRSVIQNFAFKANARRFRRALSYLLRSNSSSNALRSSL